MLLLGKTRYINLRILNGATPVTGLTLSDLAIFFTRDDVACADVLTLAAHAGGRYTLKYTPSAEGHDYIDVSYAPASFFVALWTEVLSPQSLAGGSAAISLTQNTPTTNALKVLADDPAQYTLYVYESSDWTTGNTETYAAVASTQLDSSGNWLSTPLSVTTGTYHIVIRNLTGTVQVIAAFLQV